VNGTALHDATALNQANSEAMNRSGYETRFLGQTYFTDESGTTSLTLRRHVRASSNDQARIETTMTSAVDNGTSTRLYSVWRDGETTLGQLSNESSRARTPLGANETSALPPSVRSPVADSEIVGRVLQESAFTVVDVDRSGSGTVTVLRASGDDYEDRGAMVESYDATVWADDTGRVRAMTLHLAIDRGEIKRDWSFEYRLVSSDVDRVNPPTWVNRTGRTEGNATVGEMTVADV
jgi:hypothetical protein